MNMHIQKPLWGQFLPSTTGLNLTCNEAGHASLFTLTEGPFTALNPPPTGQHVTTPSILSLLRSDRIDVSLQAAKRLAEIGHPRAVKLLFDRSMGTYDAEQKEYVKLIIGIGEPAVDQLISLMADTEKSDWFFPLYIAWMLGEIGDKRALQPISERLWKLIGGYDEPIFGEDPPFPLYGVEALVKIYEANRRSDDIRDQVKDSIIAFIEKLFADYDDYVGESPSFINQALNALKRVVILSTEDRVQIRAGRRLMIDLVKNGLAVMTEHLPKLTSSEELDDCTEAVDELVKFLMEHGSVKHIPPLLVHPSYIVRGVALDALRSRKNHRGVSRSLTEGMMHEDANMRSASAIASVQLAEIFIKSSGESLLHWLFMTLLDDHEPRVRIAGAMALGALSVSSATEKLITLATEDPHPGVVQAALLALQKIL
jgi:hypothetical protein